MSTTLLSFTFVSRRILHIDVDPLPLLISNSFARIPLSSGACPGIRKGGWGQNLKPYFFFFFFAFQFFRGGGPAQNAAEKMIFSPKKVTKYR